jgi:putative nucleotidyltransferase with HDIG domain
MQKETIAPPSPCAEEIPFTPFPREHAVTLLRQHVKNENLVKHMFAVEAVMRALAVKYGGKTDQWGLAGLLHDIDWEETENDFTQHSIKSAGYLTEAGIDPAVVQAIKVHNHTHGFPLTTMMEKALFSAEELTGIITACALVQPSKKLADVTVESVLKKFKQPSFAKGVNREVILQAETLLGMSLKELAELELKAMQEIADTLGL